MSSSGEWLQRARRVIPGGVNSPVRAFGAVGGDPLFISRGQGAEIIDLEGRSYLDLVGSWGALLLGHAHPAVVEAACAAAATGSSFGAPTVAEVEFAEALTAWLPSLERVRCVSSGTEATMHALRLARGFTGREKVVKFAGCYHGAHDSVLVRAGSGVATFALPGSPGVPSAVAQATLVAPFNDLAAVEALFAAWPEQVAAVLVEPVAGNMGTVPPRPGFLAALRELCNRHGALLIFDEVMTGFRVHQGSAQGLYGVQPDLSCFGKVVGGGYPLAVFGGRAEVMERLAPLGPVYQAGTLSGNPVAVAAGLATLRLLDTAAYARLEAIGRALEAELLPRLPAQGASWHRVGGMFTLYFRPEAPWDFQEVQQCDLARFSRFFHAALAEGVYLPPSQFEAAFLNVALSDEQVHRLAVSLGRALEKSV